MGHGIVDLLESEGQARKPVIADKKQRRIQAQEQYFKERRQEKRAEREQERQWAREEAKDNNLPTPEFSEGGSEPDSQEPLGEEEMEEQANNELDAELTSY